MGSGNGYRVEKIARLSIRYYLVKIHHRYYIIDYCNPRDLRNFFVPLFPKASKEWLIYDVTDDKEKYLLLKKRKPLPVSKYIGGLFLFYFMESIFLSKQLNLGWLTYAPQMYNHIMEFAGLLALFALLIMLTLIVFQNQILNPQNTRLIN